MKVAIACYPTYGGSGVIATELGLALAEREHEVHFLSYEPPYRLGGEIDGFFGAAATGRSAGGDFPQ